MGYTIREADYDEKKATSSSKKTKRREKIG